MKTSIKVLIWLYIALLLFEGALRKWFLPSLADPLLIVRDPVLLGIYALAFGMGIFPKNNFILAIAGLGLASGVFSIIAGQSNLLVISYGLRIDFLHLPLIWVMGAVLDRRDVERIGAFLLLMAIPMTIIMVAQFSAPMNAWINRGIGNDEVGQLFGADGRIRPPGLFSFITGPQLFFPLCAAFFFDEISGASRLPWYIISCCGLAIGIALPVSISRTVMLATAAVAAVFVLSIPFSTARFSKLTKPILLLVIVGAALCVLPVFRQGASVFMMRWDSASSEDTGGAWGGIAERTLTGFTNTFYFVHQAPFFGRGIGTGSNVGARLTSGNVGFLLAEEEWGKIILELGPLLGCAFILFRTVLTVWLGLQAWQALRSKRNLLPLLIFTASALTILQGQWAPPTVLGFTVVGGGLLLAATTEHRRPKKTKISPKGLLPSSARADLRSRFRTSPAPKRRIR